MKIADSRSFLVSIPRGRENEKVVKQGLKSRGWRQIAVIGCLLHTPHLQSHSSKKIHIYVYVYIT